MKIFLFLIASFLTTSFAFAFGKGPTSPAIENGSFALQGLPQELNDPSSYTSTMLENIYRQADENVSPDAFEDYVEVDSTKPQPATTEAGIYYYNKCLNFGASSMREIDQPWKLGGESLAFKVSKQNMNQFGSDFVSAHYENPGELPEVFFVGGWSPDKEQLVYSISKIFSANQLGGKLNISVNKNNVGIYSDFPGPVLFSYRTFKGVLIGKMTTGTGVAADYQVCYRPSSYFCHISGKSGNVVINLVSRGETSEEAKSQVLNEANDDLFYCSDAADQSADSKNRCQAAQDAKRSLECSEHYEDLDLNLN